MTPEQRKHKVEVTLGQISDILDEALRDARNEALEDAAGLIEETGLSVSGAARAIRNLKIGGQ